MMMNYLAILLYPFIVDFLQKLFHTQSQEFPFIFNLLITVVTLFEGKNTKLMKDKKLEANLSMAVSKIFSGLNMNALKYLLPLWMSPLTGATLRCTFAAVAFWVIGWFMPPEKSSTKDKWLLFLLGAFGLYGFMFLYLAGLSKTTPVSSSIFTSLQPIWVFLIMIFFYKEKATDTAE